VLNAGAGQTLSVTFTPTDAANYTGATDDDHDHRAEGEQHDQLVSTGRHHLRRRAERDTAQCDRQCAGRIRLLAGLRHGAERRCRADAVGHLHADRCGELHDGHSDATTINVLKANSTISWSAPADIVYGTALSATQLNATTNVPGSFAYSPAASTVLNAGAAQTLSVTFTPTDAANYTGATATTTINVLKANSTISWSAPADIVYGTALSATQLNATANVPGSFVYAPVAGTVLNAGSGQTLSVTFTPTDAANYTTATATTTINVLKANSTISWSAPADIVYGTALSATQLNATANVPGSFVYAPAVSTVLNAGAGQTLSVTFTPTDSANYSGATATTTITVLKANSTISWSAPADIVYGTALSATQLNATANVPGTLRLLAGRRHRVERGLEPDAVGDVHPDRRGELHDGDRDDDD
jgi:hypothetical protein